MNESCALKIILDILKSSEKSQVLYILHVMWTWKHVLKHVIRYLLYRTPPRLPDSQGTLAERFHSLRCESQELKQSSRLTFQTVVCKSYLVANYPTNIVSGLVHPSDLHGIFVGLIHWNNSGELTHLRFVGWATK